MIPFVLRDSLPAHASDTLVALFQQAYTITTRFEAAGWDYKRALTILGAQHPQVLECRNLIFALEQHLRPIVDAQMQIIYALEANAPTSESIAYASDELARAIEALGRAVYSLPLPQPQTPNVRAAEQQLASALGEAVAKIPTQAIEDAIARLIALARSNAC